MCVRSISPSFPNEFCGFSGYALFDGVPHYCWNHGEERTGSLFILFYFFQMSFQTRVLASLECNLDSRRKLYGPCNVPTCLSSRRNVRITIRSKDDFMFGTVIHIHESSNEAHWDPVGRDPLPFFLFRESLPFNLVQVRRSSFLTHSGSCMHRLY